MSHGLDSVEPGSGDAPTDLNQRILVEKVNLLQHQLPVLIIGGLLACSIMIYWLWQTLPAALLSALLAAMIAISLLRFAQLIQMRKIPTQVSNVQRRSTILTVLSALSGLTWGVLGFAAVSEIDPVSSLIMIMVLTGMVASATASLAHLPLPYYLFILPAMVPAALKFFSFSDDSFYWIGLLILLYLAVSVQFSRGVRHSALQAIKLRFDNLNLIDRLRAEKQRAENAAREADRSNESKSRFMAAASHDLRQPLQALRLLAATLKVQAQPESSSAPTISSIDESVNALNSLFDSLLDISKLDAGTIDITIEHFHLLDLLNRIRPDFLALATEKQLRYTCPDTDAIVATDKVLLERVVRNIVHNAIRYTRDGEVSVTAVHLADQIELRIADTGKGIAEHDTATIFEEFVQLDNPERDRSKGLGLGLSIVKRITTLLDLELNLVSTPGRGTCVSVTIPCGDNTLARTTQAPQVNAHANLEQLFVLIIDDEQAVRQALQGLLQQWGCTVLMCSSANQALPELSAYEYEPDIILADYRLRENKTGPQAIAAIRSHYQKRIPAVIITGDVAADRLIELNKLGEPVMHKPCDPAILYGYLSAGRNPR